MKTIIAHPEHEEMGKKIAKNNPSVWNYGKIDLKDACRQILSSQGDVLRDEDVTYIGDYSKPWELLDQYALIRAVRDKCAAKVRIICPYFPVGTMERISKKWEVATARYFADILGYLNPTPERSGVRFSQASDMASSLSWEELSTSTLLFHPKSEWYEEVLRAKHPSLKKWSITVDTFPDGWPKLFINDEKEDTEHKSVVYISDFSDPENFFQEYSLIRALIDYYADSVKIVVPSLPEFLEKNGKEYARYFIDLLASIPPWRKSVTKFCFVDSAKTGIPLPTPFDNSTPFGGLKEKPSIHTFDIHALVERFIFDPNQANTELHTTLSLLEIPEDMCIAFPDDGAAKRFWESFPKHKDKIICIKVRGEGNQRIVSVKEGNPKGKRIIIVDDLAQTGGTLSEAADLFISLWAKWVEFYCPHGVFPNHSETRMSKNLSKMTVSDSIPANNARQQHVENMVVVSIGPLVEKIILRSDE